jgi:hypothetical protein
LEYYTLDYIVCVIFRLVILPTIELMTTLKILAGPKAYTQIKQNGLAPTDISAVFGASGAAKWLTIYGLDLAIFSQWLPASDQSIDLFGTSVGAFKLAAAAQTNSVRAMDLLADAYINQRYEGKVTARQVAIETSRILAAFLSPQTIDEILTNPRYNYHCGAVLCKGLLASDNVTVQKLAMGKAFLLSLIGRKALRNTFDRAVFYGGKPQFDLAGGDAYTTHKIALNSDNFRDAILASGSIPVVMPGVADVAGGPAGNYRDGGLLDYHPVPANIGDIDKGLVLYPHFYTEVKEGWFDKFSPKRVVSAQQLDNVVLIGPSDDFVKSLPGGAIPDRKDFYTFKGNDPERIRRWTIAKDRSGELGEEFMQLASSGDIAAMVAPLQ